MVSNVPLFSFEVPASARAAFKPLVRNRLLNIERKVAPRMKQAMLNYMQDVVESTIVASPLQQRSGTLAKSLRAGVKVTGSSIDGLKGTYRGVSYADILMTGGTLSPKNAEVLTLPLPAALRADGTPKLSGPKAWKRYGTFSYTSKKTGQGYLAYKNAAGKLVLLYMYVERVKVLKKLPLRDIHRASLSSLMAVWGDIMVEEMLDVNLMSIVSNPNSPAKSFNRAKLAGTVRGIFRPVFSR
jgi:hypothetical protein